MRYINLRLTYLLTRIPNVVYLQLKRPHKQTVPIITSLQSMGVGNNVTCNIIIDTTRPDHINA